MQDLSQKLLVVMYVTSAATDVVVQRATCVVLQTIISKKDHCRIFNLSIARFPVRRNRQIDMNLEHTTMRLTWHILVCPYLRHTRWRNHRVLILILRPGLSFVKNREFPTHNRELEQCESQKCRIQATFSLDKCARSAELSTDSKSTKHLSRFAKFTNRRSIPKSSLFKHALSLQ